jgi:hypothetical protein
MSVDSSKVVLDTKMGNSSMAVPEHDYILGSISLEEEQLAIDKHPHLIITSPRDPDYISMHLSKPNVLLNVKLCFDVLGSLVFAVIQVDNHLEELAVKD